MACWRIENNKILCNVQLDNTKLSFELPNKILPYLVSHTPQLFYFNFYYDGKKYTKLLDLQGIYIPKSKKNKLKILVSKSQERNVLKDNKYSIARGESFKERYLTPWGWQVQEYFFSIKLFEEREQITVQPSIQAKKEKQKDDNQQSIYKECQYCGAVLPADFEYCPYCKKYIAYIDKDADITI